MQYILILLAIGDKDSSVPIELVYYFKSQFQKAEKANLKVSIYPEKDHRLESKEKNYRSDFF